MRSPREGYSGSGPFAVEGLKSGDRYELSDGHAIYCAPSGGQHCGANLVGAAVLESDPKVTEAGVDAGYTFGANLLRAPDIAVGNVPNAPGWIKGAPTLAVEYADLGQDEADLQVKISELFAAGTKLLWVVRLSGPRRVEVHQPGEAMRVVGPDGVLEAPGILANPVPVPALYDRDAAHEATLHNLLQRKGVESLERLTEDAFSQGREGGKREGKLEALRNTLVDVLSARGLPSELAIGRISACADEQLLRNWVRRAAVASAIDEVFFED